MNLHGVPDVATAEIAHRQPPEARRARGAAQGPVHRGPFRIDDVRLLLRGAARSCLLARRLVERGVRVVQVIHASWDHHRNLDTELPHNCLMADQPVAALITDQVPGTTSKLEADNAGQDMGPLGPAKSGGKP